LLVDHAGWAKAWPLSLNERVSRLLSKTTFYGS
jgi:hypothetical protein